MNMELEQGETPIIFLAMFWGGGGPYTIADIIDVYDWVNRSIPNRADMESALNTLLAMGLIEKQEDQFLVPATQGREFDAFRKKKRKNKFNTVRIYFEQLPSVAKIPKVITLTEEQYQHHLKEKRIAFNKAV
jgi:hypothetical protein